MSIPADLVPPDGFVIAPATARATAPAAVPALTQRLASAPAPVTTFKPSTDTRTHVARAVANVRTLATLRSPSMSHGAP